MDIIKTINPLCLALSPLAVAARAIHQIPIAMKQKTRDLTYNKYKDDVLPADTTFACDIWQSFQYMEWQLNDKWCGVEKWEQRTNQWSMKHFGIPANCIQWNGTPKSYVEMITRKKPSEVIRNHTHLCVICNNLVVIVFIDHYYSDGLILKEFFCELCIDEQPKFSKIPVYTYYPFISDAMAIQLMTKQTIELFKYPSQIQGIGDKTRILTKTIYPNNDFKTTRWVIYAVCTLPIFESMPNVEYLHIGLSVAFETDQTYGNNRIGVIPIRITRPKKSTYNEQISNLMEQYKIQVMANYMDAHTTYDILRGYDTSCLRNHKFGKYIDIIFTAFYFKEEIPKLDNAVGGFLGSFSTYELMYINAMSCGTKTHLTYVSNLKQMNYDTFVNDGMTIKYEFDNKDPGQF